MKKIILLPIILGSVILIGGAVVFAVGVSRSLKNNDHVTNTYDITDDFTKFNINLSTADLSFEATTDGSKKVVCEESTKQYHDVKVENGALTIQYHNELKWYERLFNWDFYKRKVTVYLPAEEYGELKIDSSTGDITVPAGYTFSETNIELSTGDVSIKSNVTNLAKIKTSTGDISLSDMSAKNIDLKVSTGKVNITNVNVTEDVKIKASTGSTKTNNVAARNFDVDASTGNVTFTNSVMSGKITVTVSTGNVKFEDSDAASLDIKTSTGDVTGTLLTAKIFDARSDTGSVKVPPATEWSGGLCQIKTDTGRINISVK